MHEGKFETVTVVAATDLTSFEHRVVNVGGTLAANALTSVGAVKSTRADSGHAFAAAYKGFMKLHAGGAVNSGAAITVASGGWVTAAVSGGYTVGKCITGAASGDFAACIADFSVAAVRGG